METIFDIFFVTVLGLIGLIIITLLIGMFIFYFILFKKEIKRQFKESKNER